MKAGGSRTANSGIERAHAEPGLLASLGMALRLITGWFCLVIGVFDLIVDLDRQTAAPDVSFLIFHAVLLAGGSLLLGLGRLAPRPGLAGYVAGGAILLLGTLVSAMPATTSACCLPTFAVRHGYPFPFAARDDGGRWHVDGSHLAADLIFWALAGLIVLVVIAVLRPAPGDPESDGETVGPLP